MERVTKRVKKEADISKPLVVTLNEDDCFGHLWDPTCYDCSACADNILCSIAIKGALDAKQAVLEATMGPFLDQLREPTDDELSTIEREVSDREASGDAMSVSELKIRFKDLMRTKDDALAVDRIKAFIQAKKTIRTKSGFCYTSQSA